jgi:hypothetical protein
MNHISTDADVSEIRVFALPACSFLLIVLWRIKPLLGQDLETNNVTNVAYTAVAMQ